MKCYIRFALAAFACFSLASSALAGLVGGTYTNGGAVGTSWPTNAQNTASPLFYQSSTNPSNGVSAQGYPGADNSGTGAILSEIVTPSSTFTLDTISVELAGASTVASGFSLHLFTLGTATAMPNLASDSSAFYFVNTDLLGGGSGLPFTSGGVTSTALINFTLDNTGTTDKVTLNAGTSYAVELWNQTSPFSQNALTWDRSAIADPGGQGFAQVNTTNAASRTTLAANSLAGGAPRVFQVALYGTVVPEPASFVLLAVGGLGILAGSSRMRRH